MLLPWLRCWMLDPYLVAIIVYSLLSPCASLLRRGGEVFSGIFSFVGACRLTSKGSELHPTTLLQTMGSNPPSAK